MVAGTVVELLFLRLLLLLLLPFLLGVREQRRLTIVIVTVGDGTTRQLVGFLFVCKRNCGK